MSVSFKVEGLDELRARFKQWPGKFSARLGLTMRASLDVLRENVPAYPARPDKSKYVRTGTLGRTLGAGIQGEPAGTPDIYQVVNRTGYHEASFGSKLDYAPYVIGEREQAWMHKGRWWTIKTVAEKALPKLTRIFNQMAEQMAAWLDGKRA